MCGSSTVPEVLGSELKTRPRPLEEGMAMAALQFALNRLFVVTANLGTVFEDVS